MDYDFIPFVAVMLLAAVVASSVLIPMTLSPATFDGLDHKGDSGLVVAGSGNEPAEVTGQEVTEVTEVTASQLHITSGTAEETTAVDSEREGLVIRIVWDDSGKPSSWMYDLVILVCLGILVAIVVGIWILVRKEFRHG